MIKNNFRILKRQYAYLQTILKAPVKFEKVWPKTVGGVAGRRYILPIHFCSIRTRKKSKLTRAVVGQRSSPAGYIPTNDILIDDGYLRI